MKIVSSEDLLAEVLAGGCAVTPAGPNRSGDTSPERAEYERATVRFLIDRAAEQSRLLGLEPGAPSVVVNPSTGDLWKAPAPAYSPPSPASDVGPAMPYPAVRKPILQ